MKDSVRTFRQALRLAAVAATTVAAACGRSNKTADVAQDSILVKDADVSANKSDTAGAATAALVREKGATAQLPTLTDGAPVTRSADIAPPVARTPARATTVDPRLAPPKRTNPSPVLPPRESSSTSPRSSVISSPTSPQPVTPAPPVTQPVSPSPPPVTQPVTPPVSQPTPPPKKDSSSDSVGIDRRAASRAP